MSKELQLMPSYYKEPQQFVLFTSEITDVTTTALIGHVGELVAAKVPKLTLLLNTAGGDGACGLATYNTLRGMDIEITTYNIAHINSSGLMLFLAGDKRIASRHSSFTFHKLGVQINGPVMAREFELRQLLADFSIRQAAMNAVYTERANLDENAVQGLFQDMNVVKTAFEALDMGIVTHIQEIEIPSGSRLLAFDPGIR